MWVLVLGPGQLEIMKKLNLFGLKSSNIPRLGLRQGLSAADPCCLRNFWVLLRTINEGQNYENLSFLLLWLKVNQGIESYFPLKLCAVVGMCVCVVGSGYRKNNYFWKIAGTYYMHFSPLCCFQLTVYHRCLSTVVCSGILFVAA